MYINILLPIEIQILAFHFAFVTMFKLWVIYCRLRPNMTMNTMNIQQKVLNKSYHCKDKIDIILNFSLHSSK